MFGRFDYCLVSFYNGLGVLEYFCVNINILIMENYKYLLWKIINNGLGVLEYFCVNTCKFILNP
jgi:hypothetical protein